MLKLTYSTPGYPEITIELTHIVEPMMVAFGEYLLSEARQFSLENNDQLSELLEQRLRQVSDADLQNFYASR